MLPARAPYPVDIEPAQEGVLDHVLRIRDRAQHPLSDADKTRAQWIEDASGVLAPSAIRRP